MTKVIWCPPALLGRVMSGPRPTVPIEPSFAHPRFTLAATVMMREAAKEAAVLVQLKNISLSGCYLETPRQLSPGARIRVVLQLADVRADVWGVVSRRDEKGLGVRFTNGATVEDWKRLECFIKGLCGTVPSMGTSASG